MGNGGSSREDLPGLGTGAAMIRDAYPADEFRPSASIDALKQRADLLRRLRCFFHNRGFFEVETPVLSADTVVDRHLDPLSVTMFDDPREPGKGRPMWLQTSPEFGMKRLLAAGAKAIYQVTRAFRGGERGVWHNPEFTIVEWYRVGDGLEEGMQLLSDLSADLLAAGPAERMSYRDAFLTHVGVDPHVATTEQLAEAANRHGVSVPDSLREHDRDDWLDLLLVDCIQPYLGRNCPSILYDYPAGQAALSRLRDGAPPVAERFELFVSGVELANGFHELLDADVLRARNKLANNGRIADGKYALPEESRLLAAMTSGLPACAGAALGFDRLAMLATGARDIAQIIAFPVEIA
jgi:lysyl-tRNA synthetase class 2